jgi:hypothetical protein
MATLFNVTSPDARNIRCDRADRNTFPGNRGALIGPIHPTANMAPVAQKWREFLQTAAKFVPTPNRTGSARRAVRNLIPSCKV